MNRPSQTGAHLLSVSCSINCKPLMKPKAKESA